MKQNFSGTCKTIENLIMRIYFRLWYTILGLLWLSVMFKHHQDPISTAMSIFKIMWFPLNMLILYQKSYNFWIPHANSFSPTWHYLSPLWFILNLVFIEKIWGFAIIVIDNLLYLFTWVRWAPCLLNANVTGAHHARVKRNNKSS